MEGCSSLGTAYDKLDDALDKMEMYFYSISYRARDIEDISEAANRNNSPGFWTRTREAIIGEELAYVSSALHHDHETLWLNDAKIKAIRKEKYKTQDSIEANYQVFGWHPHWMGDAYKSYNYNLLSSIAYFSYDVEPNTGSYKNKVPINGWMSTPMIDSAKAAGCKVLLTISCLNRGDNELFLKTPSAQEALLDSIQSLLTARNADGVNLDFEFVPSSLSSEFTTFVNKLRTRLDSAFISLTLPAVYSSSFDIYELSKQKVVEDIETNANGDTVKILPRKVEIIDQFVLMGYDFHKRRGNSPTPVAPWPQLERSVNMYLGLGIPAKKLLLAVPYFGSIWETNIKNGERLPQRDLPYRAIVEKGLTPAYNNKFPEGGYSAFATEFPSDSVMNTYWYDDVYTLGYKYDMVKKMGIGGIGIWALGYDNGRTELWELIDDKFGMVPAFQPNYAFSNRVAYHQLVLLAVGIFFMAAIFVGFIISLFHWRVREFLFLDKRLLLTYAGVFSAIGLLMIWLQPYKYNNANFALILGLLIGFIMTQVINVIFRSWRENDN